MPIVAARPLIGISSYGRAGERQTFSLPCEYVDVVRLIGGVPVILPPVDGEVPEGLDAIEALILPGGGDVDPVHYGGVHHEANYGISAERDGFELALARAALARADLPVLCICRGMQLLNVALGAIDGLILPGGGDVDPAHYGGVRHEANYGISPERDGFEMTLARAAIADGDLPILCICRGMQLLNVTLGGSLVAHIPDHYGERIVHRHPERLPVEHEVWVDPTSRLGTILGAGDMTVQSIHHQAVGRVAKGLRPVAWSPDVVIEAIESADHRFLIAVQWHPELGALGDGRQRRLFEELVTHRHPVAARRVASSS